MEKKGDDARERASVVVGTKLNREEIRNKKKKKKVSTII